MHGLFFADLAGGRFKVALVSGRHFRSADRLIGTHAVSRALRTLDALQLAVAVELHRRGAAKALVASAPGDFSTGTTGEFSVGAFGETGVDDALDRLAAVDERKARVVEMRFFAGLSVEETASVLNVSQDTVMRDWRLARAWLLAELSE